jgi:putative FmdB family regulatory protein
MPIFEYVCQRCFHHFEFLALNQRRAKCPSCASVKLERQVEVFTQGRPAQGPLMLNSDRAIAHARALLGDIPTIPRYQTKMGGSPGRRSRRATVAR